MESSLDYRRHFSLQINALKYLGLSLYIPYPIKSIWFWFGIFLRIIIGITMFIIPTGGQLIYLIKLLVADKLDISQIAGVLNLVLTELSCSCKLLDLRIRRDALKQLLDELSNADFYHHLPAQRTILQKAIEKSRKLYTIYICAAALDVFGHVVLAPALNKFRTLPLKMDLIFIDVNDPKYFNYICFYQVLFKPWIVTAYVVLQTLPWSAMGFAVSQLDVLIYNFENMKELVKTTMTERHCDENEAFRIILKRCILHHTSILSYVKKIQETCSTHLSASLFMSACINGTTAMQFFSIESPLKNLTEVFWVSAYLLIFIGTLFTDTYFGNSVTVKAAYLPTAVYSCPWLKLNNKLKRSLIIFISKTQQPLVITAFKTVPVSLESFTKVMNWTYKGFAILNQMK